MAIVANTLLTFSAKGIREQLSDIIFNISPEETPLVSMMAKDKVKGTLNEWQTDALGAADANNAQLEGDDITSFPAITPTVRVGNYQQISHKLLVISGTQEAVEKAGRQSEVAYQTGLRGSELKLDMEKIVFSAQAGVAGNSTTARKTAALNAWVKSNVDMGVGGVNPSWTSGVPTATRTDGTLRTFTETILKSVLQKGWLAGANFKHLFVGPVNKQRASAFAGIATKNYNVNDTPKVSAIIAAADVYIGDFGQVDIIPSRLQREADGWLIDESFLQLDTLRPFQREQLAKTGDAEKRVLRVEWGLRVKNELALGLCADLITT